MPSLSVATAGAFGSSSVLVPRELAIYGKKKRKERKEDKERNAYALGLAGGLGGGGAWAQLELPDTLF